MSEIDLGSRIFDELIFIKSELNEIKEHMVDVDSIISEEERQLVRESLIHEKEGKLIPLIDFKKQQGLWHVRAFTWHSCTEISLKNRYRYCITNCRSD